MDDHNVFNMKQYVSKTNLNAIKLRLENAFLLTKMNVKYNWFSAVHVVRVTVVKVHGKEVVN